MQNCRTAAVVSTVAIVVPADVVSRRVSTVASNGASRL
jgi:hypothetical protein